MITVNAPQIRAYYATGNYNYTYLGKMFNCDWRTIKRIIETNVDKYIRTVLSPKGPVLIEPYKDFIRKTLKKNPWITVKAIYEMIKGKGANISKSTVYNAVQTIKRELELAIERYETQPGQQAQVDWAYLPGMRVNENGHEVPVYAFLFILGYSRSVYVEFVTSMKTKTMISCLQHAFESVGGVPKEVLFDNCAQVVNLCINPDNKYKKDRAIIPEFQSFADYTGFKIVLCDPYTPQQKGKIENTVKFLKNTFIPFQLRKTGIDLDDLNKEGQLWCKNANDRIHGTTGEKPSERLKSEGLSPLPDLPFLENNTVKVTRDGSVYYHGYVYRVSSIHSGAEGHVVDLENTLFLVLNGDPGHPILLGKRNLPAFVRARYGRTSDRTPIRQKHHRRRRGIKEWISIAIDVFGNKVITDHNGNKGKKFNWKEESNLCLQKPTI